VGPGGDGLATHAARRKRGKNRRKPSWDRAQVSSGGRRARAGLGARCQTTSGIARKIPLSRVIANRYALEGVPTIPSARLFEDTRSRTGSPLRALESAPREVH